MNITTSRFNRGQEYVERNNMNSGNQRFGPDHTQKFDDIDKGMKEVEDERQKVRNLFIFIFNCLFSLTKDKPNCLRTN